MDLHNNSKGRELFKSTGGNLQDTWNAIVDEAAKCGLKAYDATTKTVSNTYLCPAEIKELKEIKVSDYVQE